MDRRTFVVLLAAAPLARQAAAQGASPRIGVLVLGNANPASAAVIGAFQARLQQLGWTVNRNVRLDIRWGGTAVRTAAEDLVRSAPDLIVAQGAEGIAPVAQLTHSIPTVFVQVSDPVGAGLVASIAKPGGNVTGVANLPASIAGDRVRLLKEIAPGIRRLFLVHDRNDQTPAALLQSATATAAELGMVSFDSGVRDENELDKDIRDFAQATGGALVVFPSLLTVTHAQRIVGLAAQYRLPAVYPLPNFAAAGGLVAYGVNAPVMWQEAAVLADKILRGTPPGQLPVYVPQEAEIVVNLKTASALGLTLPATLRARVSRLIE